MVFTRYASFRAPIGALRWPARGRGHCRRKRGRVPQSAQANRGTLYRVNKYQIRRGQRPTSRGGAEPLCARTKRANREGFFFSPTRSNNNERRTGKISGSFLR